MCQFIKKAQGLCYHDCTRPSRPIINPSTENAGLSWLRRVGDSNKKPIVQHTIPWAPFINSRQAFWYSSSSMVTFTSTSSPLASSLTSSVTKKSCRCLWRVPSWYIFHKIIRAGKLSAWTVRHTQPSVIWTSLVPAGSTQVCTAATSWSNEDQRLNTSMAETTVRPPATTLNTVLMFTTENNKNIYICFVIWLILQRIVVLFFQLIRAAKKNAVSRWLFVGAKTFR